VTVTATFRLLYVFVVIEHGSRRLMHVNVTAHPSAAWTLQQMREVIADTNGYGYLLHDRDSIFAKHLDDSIRALGLGVLRSLFASPKANSICERVIGTIRRECLDWVIPLSEPHLRSILHEWVSHYNGGRPHSALGPGVPGPPFVARCGEPKPKLGIDGCRARKARVGWIAPRVLGRADNSVPVAELGWPPSRSLFLFNRSRPVSRVSRRDFAEHSCLA